MGGHCGLKCVGGIGKCVGGIAKFAKFVKKWLKRTKIAIRPPVPRFFGFLVFFITINILYHFKILCNVFKMECFLLLFKIVISLEIDP